MKWVFNYLKPLRSRIAAGVSVKVIGTLAELMKNKTCFIIAHRLSTIQNAHTILVVKDGSIIEQGNHEQLLEQRGFYYSLYHSQFN